MRKENDTPTAEDDTTAAVSPKIILFAAVDFNQSQVEGTRVIKDEDIENLGVRGFNDVTSSLIVIEGEWTLYSAHEWGGTRWHVNSKGGPDGDGCYPHWNDWGGANDVITGVRRGTHN